MPVDITFNLDFIKLEVNGVQVLRLPLEDLGTGARVVGRVVQGENESVVEVEEFWYQV